ncbi:hypothetical protein [Pseudoalteromonas xiamenensis]
MKNLSLLAVLVLAPSVFAKSPINVEELQGLQIQPETVLDGSAFVTVDGAENVQKGQILVGENGLDAYRATGEVIIKLASVADADKLAQTHGLTLKQAYKQYYIVTASKTNLNDVIISLKKDGTVLSASLDLRDLGVSVK